MKLDTLKELHCPYCDANLEVAKEIDIIGENINQAIVGCNCRTYPLVEGILVLKNQIPDSDSLAASILQAGQFPQALYYLLRPKTTIDRFIQAARRRKLPFSIIAEEGRLKQINYYLHKTVQTSLFSRALLQLNLGGYGDYFLYRFSNTSFVAGVPLILIMEPLAGTILEIGSGMGHQGFVMSQLYPKSKRVVIDYSFINLLLAKRFFVPEAEYICLDANDPLPFPDTKFSAIFSSDVLHYLDSKKLVMREIARISKPGAVILLSHLHNLGGSDPVAGKPLTAEGWMRLSAFLKAKLLPEQQVFHNFLSQDILDLSYNASVEELKESNAFALVATNHEKIFRTYERIGERFFNLQTHLIINPLYHVSSKGREVILRKNWPSAFIQAENIIIDRIMPDTYSLDKEALREIQEGGISSLGPGKVIDLMKKFIFINVPKNYS
jgi:SAM-dependent methyltransferase/uncharacterized protein YbaR (Trm112 family)